MVQKPRFGFLQSIALKRKLLMSKFRNSSVDTRTWTFIVAKLLPAIDKNRDKKDEGGDGPAQAAY